MAIVLQPLADTSTSLVTKEKNRSKDESVKKAVKKKKLNKKVKCTETVELLLKGTKPAIF